MIDWSTCTAVERDPDRVSGAWVFKGTRVPVAALFENLGRRCFGLAVRRVVPGRHARASASGAGTRQTKRPGSGV